MSNTKTISLDEAVEAARELPAETQAALASELMERVEDYQTPGLTPEQQKIVKERLAMPREHVSREDFLAMLRRYNPAL